MSPQMDGRMRGDRILTSILIQLSVLCLIKIKIYSNNEYDKINTFQNFY